MHKSDDKLTSHGKSRWMVSYVITAKTEVLWDGVKITTMRFSSAEISVL